MDEAVAGHANVITLALNGDGSVTVSDNGRGIPVDNHPKFPGRSAMEVIFTTLHSGGKFSGKVYETSGGLHGVGSSVVNALSDWMWVEVAKGGMLYKQAYSRGLPTSKLEKLGDAGKRRGTTVCFHADPDIFGKSTQFKPAWLYHMARSKAYLYGGVKIHWSCDPAQLDGGGKIPPDETFHFPHGLQDFLRTETEGRAMVTPLPFAGEADLLRRPAASNSPSPGRTIMTTALSIPTATPSRRRRAARMSRACAPPSPAACVRSAR